MTTFQIGLHRGTGRRIVEIFDDNDNLCAVIYPTEDGSNSIHIVSKYFAPDPFQPSLGILDVPGFVLKFSR